MMSKLKSQMNAFSHSLSNVKCGILKTTTTIPPPAEQIEVTRNDPISLKSTLQHRIWVMAGSIAILMPLYGSISAASSPFDVVASFVAGLVGYLMADLGTGFYHWAIDNYGGPSTALFGPQIVAFQGHHKYPSTITQTELCNNLHELGRSIVFLVPLVDFLVARNSATHAFIAVFASCVMLSQQFHAWAHEKKQKLPQIVIALQDACILLPRSEHKLHHSLPYNSKYCIVSGAWNGILDEFNVFEVLEKVIFYLFGVTPRSWNELKKQWGEVDGEIGDRIIN